MKIKRAHIIEITVLLTAALILFAFCLCAYYFFFIRKHSYTLYFDDVDGVIKGTPVRLMGIIVGHVRKLELKNDEIITKIVITKKDVVIPDGSKARVEFTGIVGSKSIEIMPPETNEKADGIITNDPLKIREFLDSFDTYNRDVVMLQDSLGKLENSAKGIFQEFSANMKNKNSKPIDETLDDIAGAQKNFNKNLNNLGGRIKKINNSIDTFNKKH